MEFRTRRLGIAFEASAAEERDPHLEGCEPCQAWLGAACAQASALRGLSRLQAPDELAARLFPLAETVGATETEPRWADALADLPRYAAPAVLGRLVEEELQAPEAARARRFAGDLPARRAPASLRRRVFSGAEHRGFTATSSRLVALVGSAMAAGLLIWAVLDSVEPTGTTRTFIVHHERPAKPHFLAAGLAEGWSGGSLHLGEGGRR